MAKAYIPKELRSRLKDDARGYCEYCRIVVSWTGTPPAIDHIQPESQGGPTTYDNLSFSCFGCNLKKRDRTEAPDPATSLPAPFFHPRQQRWRDHFIWSADVTLILGLTSIGRATVKALGLNRPSLPLLRAALLAHGIHPPPEP